MKLHMLEEEKTASGVRLLEEQLELDEQGQDLENALRPTPYQKGT